MVFVVDGWFAIWLSASAGEVPLCVSRGDGPRRNFVRKDALFLGFALGLTVATHNKFPIPFTND
jgi:hypothetical protein